MSFKSFILSIAILLMSASMAQATVTDVTVGTGTLSSYTIPYNNSEWNGTTQSIYTAKEIGKKGAITKIAFEVNKASAYATSVVIYLGHRSTSTFSSTSDFAQPSTLTKVYEGSITLGQALGWETLTLNTPFMYNGTDNLVVAIGNNSATYSYSLTYAVASMTGTTLYRGGWGSPLGDPLNTNYSYSASSRRANIRLSFDSDVDGATVGGITYLLNVSKATATVQGVAGDVPASLTIPSKITTSGKSYSVTAIRDYAFANAKALTQVTLPATLTSIGAHSFRGSGLTSITLPAKVKTVGHHAFYFCQCLASINLPSALTEVGDFAFAYSIPTEVTLPSTLTTLGRGAFYQCKTLTAINLPDGLTRLGSFAFKNCQMLESVVVPAGVDSIEMHTFNGCSALTSVQLPAGLQRIGESAFQSCRKMAACDIPPSVTYIGQLAFYGCYALPSFSIPSGLQYLGRGAYQYCTGLKSVTIPGHITEIPDRLFAGCSSLTSVTLQKGVTTIGREAFSGCKLAEVSWPTTVRKIGYQAFRGSSHTMVPVIPRYSKEFEPDLFFGQTNAKAVYCYADVVVPESVFGGLDVYNMTLYVKPTMYWSYRKSTLVHLFRKILPFGDMHVDGVYDVTDVAAYIGAINGKELPLFSNERVMKYDLNGDGIYNKNDLTVLTGYIAKGRTISTYKPTYSPVPDFPETEAEEESTVLYDLDSFDHNTAMGLDIINQMRFEACIEGIRNPSSTSTLLTEADYVPMQWSTDIERCVRVRAAECTYAYGHVRLNKKSRSSITSNGVYGGYECLGWAASVQGSLAQYYGEKYIWVSNGSGVTGHYTNIVDPKLRYVGVGSTNGCACLGSTTSDLSAKEHQFLDVKGFDYIPLQVATDYIDSCLMGRCRPNRTFKDFSLEISTRTRVALFAHFAYADDGISGSLMIPKGVTYKSSDATVATVDAQGFVYAKKVGSAVISGMLDGAVKGSLTVTVTCKHDYVYGEMADSQVPATCKLCGNSKTVDCPHDYVKGEPVNGVFPATCSICGKQTNITCSHNYVKGEPVNGVFPATCSICGKQTNISCSHSYVVGEPVDGKLPGKCSICGLERENLYPTNLTVYWNNTVTSKYANSYSTAIPQSNPVGSYIKPWVSSNAASGYGVFLAECSNPELLDTSGELTGIGKWLVKGVGTVTVRFYSKSNPTFSKTYTLNLTEAETK